MRIPPSVPKAMLSQVTRKRSATIIGKCLMASSPCNQNHNHNDNSTTTITTITNNNTIDNNYHDTISITGLTSNLSAKIPSSDVSFSTNHFMTSVITTRCFGTDILSTSSSSTSSSSSSTVVKVSEIIEAVTKKGKEEDVSNYHREDIPKLEPKDERMLNMLLEYKQKHGDCHVPSGKTQFARSERKRLGVSSEFASWVAQQRQLYRRFQDTTTITAATTTTTTTRQRKKKFSPQQTIYFQIKVLVLEYMGFMWSDREAQWQRSFNRYEALVQKERRKQKQVQEQNDDEIGHNNSGTSTTNYNNNLIMIRIRKTENPQMYTWVDEQRKKYQRGKLSEERIALLKEVGFEFDLHEAKWWDFYERLCQYKEEHGDTLVPVDYPNDLSLGKWVARQRRTYNHHQLSCDRVSALEALGFSWKVRDDAWEIFYEQLNDFYKEHGHARVPRSNGALWKWVNRQRQFLREVGRSDAGAALLDYEDGERKFNELRKMGLEWETNNDGYSSSSSEDDDSDDDKTNRMENNRRQNDSLDAGTEERVKRLVNLAVPAGVQDDLWMSSFRRLWDFKDRFGHFSVPYDDPEFAELSSWVRYQRFLYKRNRLASDRVAALERIDFVWSARQARWERMYEELVRFHAEHGHSRVPSKYGELYRWTKQQRKELESVSRGQEQRRGSHNRFTALEKLLIG